MSSLRFLRQSLLAALLVIVAVSLTAPLSAQRLIAEPYLLERNPSEVTVAWITEKPCQDELFVHDGIEESRHPAGQKTRFHRVTLKGLQPQRFYRYRTTGGAWHRFQTPKARNHFRFVALGHTGGSRHEFPDPDEFKISRAASLRPDFFLHCGDSVYYASVESYARELLDLFRPWTTTTPLYLAAANHEAGWPNTYGLDYRAMRSVFPREYPHASEPFYRFDHKHASFFVLAQTSITSFDCEQIQWLERELASCKSEFKIVVIGGHSLSYRLKMKREEFVDQLCKKISGFGVDLLLGGDGPGSHEAVHRGIPYYYTGAGDYFRSIEVSEYGLYISKHSHLGETTTKDRYFSKRPKTSVQKLLQHSEISRRGFDLKRGTVTGKRPAVTFSGLSVDSKDFDGLRIRGRIVPKKNAKRHGVYVFWKPELTREDVGVKNKWYRIQSVPFQTGDSYEIRVPFPDEIPIVGRPYRLSEVWLQFRTDAARTQAIKLDAVELFRD